MSLSKSASRKNMKLYPVFLTLREELEFQRQTSRIAILALPRKRTERRIFQ
jgi:hypothetical protein